MSTFKQLCHEIFETISKLRESPKDFAVTVKETFDHYRADNVLHRPGTVPLQTREGVEGALELFKELEEIDSLPPLEFSIGLALAALQHCFDTGPLGIVGHIGSRETSLQRRVESFGKWSGNLVEALDYGSSNALEVVLSLLVDDGLATRPHRKALLNPNFTKIGVGAGQHSEFKTVVCLLFAVGFSDNESLETFEPSENLVPQNPNVDEWLEGAVKLTSEIREETVQGEKVRKIKNHWEMRDGSIRIIDKVEKIEPKVQVPVVTRKSSSSDSEKKKKGSSSSDEEPEHHESHPVEHHESHPVEHHESHPVEHHESHPVEHHESHPVEHHESHPVEHHESHPVEHHKSHPVEHHESHPVEHHESHHMEHHDPHHEEHHESQSAEHHAEHHEPHIKHEDSAHSSSSEPQSKHEESSSSHYEPQIKLESYSYSNPEAHYKAKDSSSESDSDKISKESSSSEEEDKKSSSSDV